MKASGMPIAGLFSGETVLEKDQRGQRPADRHQRAHREVDAAGGDHQRHARGDDDDRGDLGEIDVEGLRVRKLGVKKTL